MAVGALALGQYDTAPMAALGCSRPTVARGHGGGVSGGKLLETAGTGSLALGCGLLAVGIDGGIATAPLLVSFGVGLWTLPVGRFLDRPFGAPRTV